MIYLVIILAFILRLVNLNQSLWLDEAVQAITAQKSLGYIFQEIKGDFHPPLYHFLMHFWTRIFGFSEVALRLPSIFFGVATVYFLYLIAKLLTKSQKLSLVIALLLATAPFHIYYSQEARMYALVTLLATGSMYFFFKTLKQKKPQIKNSTALAYFVFTLLALYADYYAFLVLLVQAIILLLKKKVKLLLIFCLFFLLYLPWLPMLLTQLKTGFLATQALPEWGRLVNLSFLKALPLTFVKFSLGRITIFNKTLYTALAGGLALIYGYFLSKALKQKQVFLWLLVPLAISWLISALIPNYQPFRLLLVLPAFYLLLALGIGKTKNFRVQVGAFILVILVNLFGLLTYYFNPYFHREDWRGAVYFLNRQQEAMVILPSEISSWPIEYYDPKSQLNLITASKGIKVVGAEPQLALQTKKVYFIRYLVDLFDPGERILKSLESQGYSKIKEISFNQIPLWEFEKEDFYADWH